MKPEGFTGEDLGRESSGIEAQGDAGLYAGEDQGKSHGGNIRGKVQEVTQGLKEKAVEKAHDATQQLRSRGEGLINQQKQRITSELGAFAGLCRDTADRLRQENRTSAAHYADLASQKMDQACDYIEHRDVNQMLRDVEGFARRRSEIVLGAMFVAGLVLARFIKASSRRGSEQNLDTGDDYGSGYGGEGLGTGYGRGEYGRYGAAAGEYPESEDQPSGSYEGAGMQEQTFTDAGIGEEFEDPSAAANPELEDDEVRGEDLSPLSTGFKQREPLATERPDALGNSPSTTPPPSGGSGI